MGKPAIKRPRHSAAPLGRQYGALPYRLHDGIEILLITSRQSRRWVIPKGWPMKGKTPPAAAAREALEEAGVVGRVGKASVGIYPYVKRLTNGAPLDCTVEVFPLQVRGQRKHWPEQTQRTAHWFAVSEAAAAVEEPALAELIESFGASLAAASPPIKTKFPAKSHAGPPAEPDVKAKPIVKAKPKRTNAKPKKAKAADAKSAAPKSSALTDF